MFQVHSNLISFEISRNNFLKGVRDLRTILRLLPQNIKFYINKAFKGDFSKKKTILSLKSLAT